MKRRDCLIGFASTPFWAGPSAAQGFPERPVTLVSGYPPGGSTDVAARLVGDGMARQMGGARVIIENRPGASGTVACEWLKRQPADGYTMLLSESSSFAIWPAMHAEGMKYDPLKDFDYVATSCVSPLIFIVSPEFPAKTLKEALDVLRSPRSADLNYSSSGAGSIPHIGAEMLRQALVTNQSRHVPYRGGAPGVLSVSKNETAWGMATAGSAAGLIQGGSVRALALTSPTRFAGFPDVPTFVESGLPEVEVNVYYLIHAPAGLPAPILKRLNEASAKALGDSTLRERYLNAGMQAWDGTNTPESTRALVEQELERFRQVSAKTGIKITG